LLNHVWIRHAGYATLGSNVSWHPLECHNCNRARVLSNFGLLCVYNVHDDAALEHFSHSALDAASANYGF
jgi:hypothetical protein